MKNPSPGVKNIITPTEAIDYFVLSRRKFYDLLKSDKQKDFLVFYKERKMIIRTSFAKYLEVHPDLRSKDPRFFPDKVHVGWILRQ